MDAACIIEFASLEGAINVLNQSAIRRRLNEARPIALMLMAFVCVSVPLSLALRAGAPMPEMMTITPKSDRYAAHADQFDTVFVGTSRTLYHVIPDEVEAAASAAGCPGWSVFNFGVQGLNGAEQDWLIDRVVETGGDALKRVVIEETLPQPKDLAEATNKRARFFHGPGQYDAIVSSIWSFPESTPKRAFRTGVAAYGVVYDLSGVGRASERFFPQPGEDWIHNFDFREDGFEALGEVTSDGIEARRAAFLEDQTEFHAMIENYDPNGTAPNLDARAAYTLSKIERLRAKGLNASYYIAPNPTELPRVPYVGQAVAAAAPDFTIMNFNQPDLYPELFITDEWHDDAHLLREGATKLSRQIGADLCAGERSASSGEAHADALR